ncbi:MAG: FAD-binding oxidoreductase [Methyloprofundus sp.]|nr:FAD-binding oxidoreductase [Methyloprofundus sp.]
MPKQVDYLIIGQGLAGSLLSWELMQHGCSIHLIDNQQENASQIAAGLINPVTGMRLVKNNQIDILLPCAKQSYQALSQFFQKDFYIAKSMLRIVRNEKEQLSYQKRRQDPNYLKYLEPELKQAPKSIHAPLGLIQQKQTGYLLTHTLLSCLKNYFQEQQSYQACQFNYQDLQLNNTVTWQGITAKKIIFCEGYQAIYNPWFNYLPFQLAKGEILTMSSEHILIPEILNYGHWLIPLDGHHFRTGASFDNSMLDTQATTQAKQQLLETLTHIYPSLHSAAIDKQQANIRPTTLDKAPFIGLHPNYKNVAIFNGFGAKGSLQIPYYSQHFVQHLLKQTPLEDQVNCLRYRQHKHTLK